MLKIEWQTWSVRSRLVVLGALCSKFEIEVAILIELVSFFTATFVAASSAPYRHAVGNDGDKESYECAS